MESMKYYAVIVLLSVSLFSCATGNLTKESASEGDVPVNMVAIEEGPFTMGLETDEPNEKPEHEVYVDAYMIDRQEVSAKDFAAFLNVRLNPGNRYFTSVESSTVVEEKVLPAGNTAKQGRLSYVARPGYENFPANNVSWFGAEEYCRWKGRRLPTEAEWEKAARGNDKRMYPWGDSIPSELRARYARDFGKSGMNVMVPVDALPAGESFYGVRNMAGNVLEWTHDWYRQNFCEFCDPTGEDYLMVAAEIICGDKASVEISEKGAVEISKKGPEVPPINNPRGPLVGIFRVLRGGSWQDRSESAMRASHRFWLDPVERYDYTGFRCAATDKKDPKEEKDEKPPVEDDLSAYITCKPKEVEIPVAVPMEQPAEVAVPPAPPSFEDIYFACEQYDITDDAKPRLQAVAEWMEKNGSAKIRLGGFSGEQGTSSYNVALGEKRAKAIKAYLVKSGIPSERLEVVSYGNEQTLCEQPAPAKRNAARKKLTASRQSSPLPQIQPVKKATTPITVKKTVKKSVTKCSAEACQQMNRRVQFEIINEK